jgi:hypothetical protein
MKSRADIKSMLTEFLPSNEAEILLDQFKKKIMLQRFKILLFLHIQDIYAKYFIAFDYLDTIIINYH